MGLRVSCLLLPSVSFLSAQVVSCVCSSRSAWLKGTLESPGAACVAPAPQIPADRSPTSTSWAPWTGGSVGLHCPLCPEASWGCARLAYPSQACFPALEPSFHVFHPVFQLFKAGAQTSIPLLYGARSQSLMNQLCLLIECFLGSRWLISSCQGQT